jgi:hypothetical protein
VRDLTPEERQRRWAVVARCQHDARLAQGEVDRMRRGIESLRLALPGAQQAVVRAESTLAQVEETARRAILKAAQEVQQARTAHADVVQHLTALAGPEAVP